MEVKKLFGTSGIRGSATELFTPQFCFDMGRTFVDFFKTKEITFSNCIGMDPDCHLLELKKIYLKVLATSGIGAFDEGVTPIPSMNWLIKNTQ